MIRYILINLKAQTLSLLGGASLSGATIEYCCTVSTALNGPGEQQGSGCTPRGWHEIRALIGRDLPINTVFEARRPTGEIYSQSSAKRDPGRDWILTRILWLSGLELGKNRLGQRDTFRRYIYIHGTPDTEPMGVPLSHGCIRVNNADLLTLFKQCFFKMRVFIN